jgi:hypothetical protein
MLQLEQMQLREEWVQSSAKLTRQANSMPSVTLQTVNQTREELLTIFTQDGCRIWAMEYYQEHLRGRRFILFTDHKPLETLGTLHTKTMSRLQLAMMDFDFEIRYKKGSEMPADFLS